MATEETNVDSQIGSEVTTGEFAQVDSHIPNEKAVGEAMDTPVDELSENASKSECAMVKEPTGTVVESNATETSGPDNSSQAVIEEHKEGDSSEVIDSKTTENIESSAGEITDTAQPTSKLPEEKKQDDKEKKAAESRKRSRSGKGIMARQLATLNLPDGIILVKDKRYTGYHCTYCNCVLRSLATVDAHVDGKWHGRTLQIRELNGESRRRKVATPSKSAHTSTAKPQPKTPKVPLKSSLEEYLSTVTTTIVGLSYIVETQRPDKKPTFQCNLCEISLCDTASIKDHINGLKHSLMYLKLVKPTQLAELLSKQMSKVEKNKEITKLSEQLQQENGRGEIIVKSAEEKETTAAKQPGSKPPNRFQQGGSRLSNRSPRQGRAGNWFRNRPQAAGNRSNRPVARSSIVSQRSRNSFGARRPSQQKRKNEGMSPARKRQLLERDIQARRQYGRERAQSNLFSDRWGMRNQAMDFYQNEANFYPDYPDFYPDRYNERRSLNRQQYMNEAYEQMSQFPEREMYRRERYVDRQSNWNARRDNFASNNPQNYSNRSASMRNAERSRNSNAPITALKHLADLNVASEEDAGVVVNAINSLTNSFMNYKLRDLSGPVQQLLQKSLKGNNLKSLLDVPTRNVGNTRDRYGGGSSQMNRDWGISQIAKPKNWLF